MHTLTKHYGVKDMYTMTDEIMDLVYDMNCDLIPWEVAKDFPMYTYEEVIAKIDEAISIK